ncbi:MAG: heat-inducible transcriptional repressor HrcA [Pseudomonadota bacterium]
MNTLSTLQSMDARAREVFRQLVETYLDSGDPVGSRTLSKGTLDLSAASIRNVMADLAGLGLLDAPHASAGRLPTHAGLRLFVDGFLELGEPSEEDRAEINARLEAAGKDLKSVLHEASDVLSGLAGGAGLVSSPKRDAPVRHVEFVPLGPVEAICILVTEDGDVENRFVALPEGVPATSLVEAGNYLSARMKGRTLAEVRETIQLELAEQRAELDAAAANLVQAGLAEWSGEAPGQGRSLIVRGRAKLLEDAEAAKDLDRVGKLFETLERQENLLDVLNSTRDAEGVRLFIGAENRLFSLTGSSLIVAPYMSAQRQVIGALGVIGPTRINYARVIPMVDYTAKVVGEILTRAGRKD